MESPNLLQSGHLVERSRKFTPNFLIRSKVFVERFGSRVSLLFCNGQMSMWVTVQHSQYHKICTTPNSGTNVVWWIANNLRKLWWPNGCPIPLSGMTDDNHVKWQTSKCFSRVSNQASPKFESKILALLHSLHRRLKFRSRLPVPLWGFLSPFR